MKRIRCPKCENYLLFDETKYSEGQSLVFVCEHCGKQFSIRLGKTKMRAPQKEERPDEEEFKDAFGSKKKEEKTDEKVDSNEKSDDNNK